MDIQRRTVGTAIDLLEVELLRAQLRGDASDWSRELRRLGPLRSWVDGADAERDRQDEGRSESELSRRACIDVLMSSLPPLVLARVVENLRGIRRREGLSEDEPNPWLELDTNAYHEVNARAEREEESIRVTVVRGTRDYERTRDPAHLRRALRSLEDAVEAYRSLEPRIASSNDEAEFQLGVALHVLPVPQRRFLADAVDARLKALTDEGGPAEEQRTPETPHSPTYSADAGDRADEEHVWFVPAVQESFEREIDRQRREEESGRRRKELEDRRHKRERDKQLRQARDREAREKSDRANPSAQALAPGLPSQEQRIAAETRATAEREQRLLDIGPDAFRLEEQARELAVDERQRLADEREIAEAEAEFTAKGLTKGEMKERGLLRPRRLRVEQPNPPGAGQ